ncbi:MAG TPA: Spy/CpxP family protein refolding chaperone [Povalibacter sp.]|uniref:Spy/CpxP family protein refolding chaperone n=1 Tax=Povalibacter sp. TaxID=1962978 RepID=UPI002B52AA97|nr:Spy/CpxP family protein refolding chaperone [Povalibacter sp.]HMN45591.1 Spy/CpxP family protein refolding chaperone [Povalibacter sp.]
MTPNRLRTSILAACAALTIAGGIAYAGVGADGKDAGQRHGHHMHRHGGAPLMGTLRQLDLTDEQKQSVRSVFANTRQQREALRDQQRSNRTALASTMPDDPKYPALIADRKKLAADAIQQSSDTQTQIYALLTPEQKAQIPQLLAERKARWEERRERFKERRNRDATDQATS